MSLAVYEKIKKDPRFNELSKRRSRFAMYLSLLVLAVYYSFVMVVAFAPELLATPIAEGFTTTIGIPVGACIIIFAWVTTGIYVRRANTEFDAINKAIVEEAHR